MIRAYLLETGHDGNSHVRRGSIRPDVLITAQSIRFAETPAHASLDWHDAPTLQYVMTLSGTLEFTTRDGEKFTVHPGELLIAEDIAGSGHEWRLVDDQPWRRAYVAFAPGTDVGFVPDP